MHLRSTIARGLTTALLLSSAAAIAAQTPPPFPSPGSTTRRPAPPQPAPTGVPPPTTPAQPAQPPAQPAPAAAATERPTEALLGAPIYPTAVFLRAYDAGRGQRYYVFGVVTPFAEMVNYYRSVLKDKGNLVFEVPPTHVFEIGRFREETMAFPPSVTVKDYSFNGSGGFPNPKPGATPERFPTIIQIVPAPAGARE
jgi:hypothetical protein